MSELRARVVVSCLVALLPLGVSCSSFAAPSDLTGSWGGEHISLVVTDSGATAQFDCASGTIDAPLVPDDAGRFVAPGTFTPGRGGPILQGDTLPSHPARYTGQVKSNTMTLTIVETDSETNVGTFTLQRGASAHVFRCL